MLKQSLLANISAFPLKNRCHRNIILDIVIPVTQNKRYLRLECYELDLRGPNVAEPALPWNRKALNYWPQVCGKCKGWIFSCKYNTKSLHILHRCF